MRLIQQGPWICVAQCSVGTSWCAAWMFWLCMMEDEVNKIIAPCHIKLCPATSFSVAQSLVIHVIIMRADRRLILWPRHKTILWKTLYFWSVWTFSRWLLVELQVANRKVVAVSDFCCKKFQFSGHRAELWETEGCYQWLSSDKSWELHPCQHSSNKPLMIELWWQSIYSAGPVHALFPSSERLW